MSGRDHTGADTPCGQSDQHIKGQLVQLGGLVVFSPTEPIDDLCSLQPLLLRRRQHLATSAYFKDKLPLSNSPSPTEQFVEHD